MDIDYKDEFKYNDKEFQKGLESNRNRINKNMEKPSKISNLISFKINIIINYLQKN